MTDLFGSGFVRWYAEANLLVLLAWALVAVALNRRSPLARGLSERTRLSLARTTLLASLAAGALAPLLPLPGHFDTAAALWPRLRKVAVRSIETTVNGGVPAPVVKAPPPASDEEQGLGAADAAELAILAFGVLWLARAGSGFVRLRGIVKRAHVVRRCRRLDVRISDETIVPYSCVTLGLPLALRAHVILPPAFAAEATDLRIALAHEGQHHRHGDTHWVLALELLRILLPLNPAVPLWRRSLSHLQEYACDEALVGRRRCGAHAYGSCLIRVTEAASQGRSTPHPFGTTGMAEHGSDPTESSLLLERRIAMLPRYLSPPPAPGRFARLVLGLVLLSAPVSAAWAAKGLKPREPLTHAQLKKLVAAMEVSLEFPIVVNDAVVERINGVLTDPEKADRLKASLERMQKVKPVISGYLERYGHPPELLALPLIESGYENLPPSENLVPAGSDMPRSAGLWQFIPATARNFGLTVNQKTDQRMDVGLETDAAMRYLGANRLRFKDWLLSVAAYNMGERAVQDAIDRGATRDAWSLFKRDLLNDYLVYVTAGVILMNNPQLLE